METRAGKLVVAHIVQSGLRHGRYYDLARLHTVPAYEFVRIGAPVRIDLDDAHVVVRTRPAAAACMVGQVFGSEERVPECLRSPVTVEDARREDFHETHAVLPVERRTHGHYALETAQVGMRLFLHAAEQGEHRGHTHQEGYPVVLGVLQRQPGIELAQDHHLTACIERRAGAAGMQASPVEPGRHVHRTVGRRQREMHYHVVRRQHFVYGIQRHTLGAAGGSRSVQACTFVIDVQRLGRLRLRFASPAQISVEAELPLRSGPSYRKHCLGAV